MVVVTVRRLRGVSLIEALVAMAIMAFGMLAIVGVQSTLRLNNETARQRSEAVRLAQQAIEDYRSFVDVTAPVVGTANYTQIGNPNPMIQVVDAGNGYTTLAGLVLPAYNSSASYTLTTTIAETGQAANSSDARMKAVQVQVDWTDRGNNLNSVMMYTTVARIAPAIVGSLGIAADVGTDGIATAPMLPGGRNALIPRQAVDFGDGTSGFIPPNRQAGDHTAWLFNNATGVIHLCTTVVVDNANLIPGNGNNGQLVCAASVALLVSGTVDFAVGGKQATAAEALAPSGLPFDAHVVFGQPTTFPGAAVGNPVCYTTAPVIINLGLWQSYVSYYCAIEVSQASNPPMVWSDYSSVTGASITWAAGGYSVCRYTLPTNPADAFVTSGLITNAQHPRTYYRVNKGLTNQNFLLVPYVNGTATDCPSGAPLPPHVTTYPQPAALQASAPA